MNVRKAVNEEIELVTGLLKHLCLLDHALERRNRLVRERRILQALTDSPASRPQLGQVPARPAVGKSVGELQPRGAQMQHPKPLSCESPMLRDVVGKGLSLGVL